MVNLATPYIWYQSPTALYGTAGAGGGFSTEAQQFINRISDHSHDTAYAAIIDSLVTNSLWSNMLGLWVLAAQNETDALVNLKSSSSTLVKHGSSAGGAGNGTFTANTGWAGVDGATNSNNFLDTTIIPNTSITSQDLMCLGVWSNVNIGASTATGGCALGCNDVSFTKMCGVLPCYSGSVTLGRVNEGVGVNHAQSTSNGFFVVNRSGTSTSQFYINGSLFYSPNTTSTGKSSSPLYVLSQNNAGTSAFGTANQLSIAFVYNASMNGTDVSNIYSAINTNKWW